MGLLDHCSLADYPCGQVCYLHSPTASSTGRALAGLASSTIASNARIQNILRGVAWSPASTTPVLCANSKAGQLIYTVRLQAPAAAMHRFRSSAGTQSMRSVYSAASIRKLRLSGEASGAFTLCIWWMSGNACLYIHKGFFFMKCCRACTIGYSASPLHLY
jgi:hypothetical protein